VDQTRNLRASPTVVNANADAALLQAAPNPARVLIGLVETGPPEVN